MLRPITLLGLAALAANCAISATSYAGDAVYEIVNRISAPDGGWDALSFDPIARRLYVARTDGVLALDVDTGKLTPQLAKGDHTHQAVPLPNNELVFTDGNTNQAIFVDAATGAPIAKVPVGNKPDAAVWDAYSKNVFVMNHADGVVSVIDPHTHRVTSTIAVGGVLEFAASDGKGHVFVNIEDQAKVGVIDVAKRVVSARIELPGCEEPSGLAYTKEGLILSACSNGVMTITSAVSGKQMGRYPIGQHPDCVIYDRTRGLAFVPGGGDGSLSIFSVKDPAHIAALGNVVTQKGSRIGAVDEKTGRIYLPAAEMVPSGTPGQRPSQKPGTFVITVLAARAG
jgi:YVTN family beta-propeller protein